jgi:hypothetical protein
MKRLKKNKNYRNCHLIKPFLSLFGRFHPPKTDRKLRMLLKSADAQKPPIIAVWLSAGL